MHVDIFDIFKDKWNVEAAILQLKLWVKYMKCYSIGCTESDLGRPKQASACPDMEIAPWK
jgi:hypothetical protein